jgi:hypothetical protein
MIRTLFVLTMIGSSSVAVAATPSTDFGIRTPNGPVVLTPIVEEGQPSRASKRALRSTSDSAAAIGEKWGRVTSTYRSPEHNRRVGGVRNSYHLSGRAIDIARRSGVRHAEIESAYRAAGYRLIESLDEGDHSHFAFGSAESRALIANDAAEPSGGTQWRMVYAPSSR